MHRLIICYVITFSISLGIGVFGLMGNGWGGCDDQQWPEHLSSWSKVQLGFVQPIVQDSDGGAGRYAPPYNVALCAFTDLLLLLVRTAGVSCVPSLSKCTYINILSTFNSNRNPNIYNNM